MKLSWGRWCERDEGFVHDAASPHCYQENCGPVECERCQPYLNHDLSGCIDWQSKWPRIGWVDFLERQCGLLLIYVCFCRGSHKYQCRVQPEGLHERV